MMPRLDGYQTCALIKQHPQLKSTPVIMLSSKDGVFDRARGRLAGSDRYLTKPFTKEGLVEAVAAPEDPEPPPRKAKRNAHQEHLIVDDSATDRQYLSDLLAKNGYKVSTAQSAEEAFAKAKQLRPTSS